MDFRDWLIVAGVVIIVGILLDGYRRMRLARKDSISMSRNMMGDMSSADVGDDFNPELPGGGARVVARGSEPELDPAASSKEAGDVTGTPVQKERVEPGFSEVQAVSEHAPDDNEFALVADAEDRVTTLEAPESDSISASKPEKVKASRASKSPHSKKTSAQSEAISDSHDSHQSVEQEVIVINVDSKPNTQFQGADIKKLLEACGLDHGEMSIFHRHEEDDLLSPIQFSVANAVEPGYFDPQDMEALATPGVSFFMSLPGPKDYMKAFEYMLETAQCFASNLQGELKDERRSVLTPQTIEHCKQRVREFERKQLSKVRA